MTRRNTVLIVDDQQSAQKTLKALLAKQDYNLAFASDGFEGLSQAAKLTPDVILLDVMMPGLDGFEVCRQLRADANLAEVPIIMVTALDDRASRLQAIEAGADDFVSKPFDQVELRARIQSILRLNRYRRLLSERAQRQEAQEKAREREYQLRVLKEIKELQDQFISNASHELRTPLSIMMVLVGNLEILYDQLNDGERREMIQNLRKYTGVLNELIDNVLNISRLDEGHITDERQPVDLVELAREEISQQMLLAEEKSQSLRLIGSEQLVVWGNRGQLQQVIRNLIDNAVKYTPNGGQITCEIDDGVSAATWPGSADLPGGRWAGLRIIDTGIGIEQVHLSRLFERFYRVQTQGNIPGTGLGLSIAHELIKLHDGHIAVNSAPGEGTVFAFYLPLLEERKVDC